MVVVVVVVEKEEDDVTAKYRSGIFCTHRYIFHIFYTDKHNYSASSVSISAYCLPLTQDATLEFLSCTLRHALHR